MTPSQLSAQLRHIAAKISSSKSPRRDLVAKDLKEVYNKIIAHDDRGDIPTFEHLSNLQVKTLGELMEDFKLELAFKQQVNFWNSKNPQDRIRFLEFEDTYDNGGTVLISYKGTIHEIDYLYDQVFSDWWDKEAVPNLTSD